MASSALQWSHSTPAIPLPTELFDEAEFPGLRKVADFLPAVRHEEPRAIPDVAPVEARHTEERTVPHVRRDGPMRVMIVGDSMTQGKEGDWTW